MRKRHALWGTAVLGVAWLSACGESMGGAGGTGGAEPSAIEPCTDPLCCVGIAFDAERSRVYLVDGEVAVYIVAKGPTDDPDATLFQAEVTSDFGGEEVCSLRGSSTTAGISGLECPASAAVGLTCGQTVSVTVRLRHAVYDPDTGSSLCETTPFGASTTWTTTVACPVCPSLPNQGDACDHSSLNHCGQSVIDPHCGGGGNPVFLGCTCGMRYDTGERTWQCSVC